MTPEQAEKLADVSSQTRVTIQALNFRLRWSQVYEQGIAHSETNEDVGMMTMDQTRFEDPPNK